VHGDPCEPFCLFYGTPRSSLVAPEQIGGLQIPGGATSCAQKLHRGMFMFLVGRLTKNTPGFRSGRSSHRGGKRSLSAMNYDVAIRSLGSISKPGNMAQSSTRSMLSRRLASPWIKQKQLNWSETQPSSPHTYLRSAVWEQLLLPPQCKPVSIKSGGLRLYSA
jgi:hypothetical protein